MALIVLLGVSVVLYLTYCRFERLRPLIAGLAGLSAMMMVISIVMYDWYGAERIRTTVVLVDLTNVKSAWSEAFANGKPLKEADIAIPAERVSGLPLHYLRMFQNGTIVLIGGYKGNRNERLLVLLPKLTRDALNWECLGGGRASYFPADCRP